MCCIALHHNQDIVAEDFNMALLEQAMKEKRRRM